MISFKKIKRNKWLLLLFSVLVLISYSNVSLAGIGWDFSSLIKSNPNSEYFNRLPLQFIDDITADQDVSKVQLTSDQKHQALVWGLSEDQEKRYVLLMQNRSGVYFKDTKLSPIEVLGINARDDSERKMYARAIAQMEFEKNAKILAFDSAFHNEALALQNKLKLPIIKDGAYLKSSPSPKDKVPAAFQLQEGDKLMLFVKRQDNASFITNRLINDLRKNIQANLNIYFIDKGLKDAEIASWAKEQNIPVELVNDKHVITLNLDKGQFDSVKVTNKTTPLLVVIRGGQSEVVNLNLFL